MLVWVMGMMQRLCRFGERGVEGGEDCALGWEGGVRWFGFGFGFDFWFRFELGMGCWMNGCVVLERSEGIMAD